MFRSRELARETPCPMGTTRDDERRTGNDGYIVVLNVLAVLVVAAWLAFVPFASGLAACRT